MFIKQHKNFLKKLFIEFDESKLRECITYTGSTELVNRDYGNEEERYLRREVRLCVRFDEIDMEVMKAQVEACKDRWQMRNETMLSMFRVEDEMLVYTLTRTANFKYQGCRTEEQKRAKEQRGLEEALEVGLDGLIEKAIGQVVFKFEQYATTVNNQSTREVESIFEDPNGWKFDSEVSEEHKLTPEIDRLAAEAEEIKTKLKEVRAKRDALVQAKRVDQQKSLATTLTDEKAGYFPEETREKLVTELENGTLWEDYTKGRRRGFMM
mgnify:CR=1 FL=1|tara:strand:+ start:211 stop:1011 length:801 start_codon:yes stop_codon:yes gene_type:complete